MIIGIAGKKGIGKTTVANTLCLNHDFKRLSFADPLKAMLKPLLLASGLSEEGCRLYTESDKEMVITGIGLSYRRLMQTLGTDWGRDMVSPHLWLHCAEKSIDAAATGIVFDDVRYDDEAALIRSKGGIIVHLRGKMPLEYDYHPSEQGIMVLDNDLVVHSSGNISDVMDRLEGFIACIG
jgi:hypothetical protein